LGRYIRLARFHKLYPSPPRLRSNQLSFPLEPVYPPPPFSWGGLIRLRFPFFPEITSFRGILTDGEMPGRDRFLLIKRFGPPSSSRPLFPLTLSRVPCLLRETSSKVYLQHLCQLTFPSYLFSSSFLSELSPPPP